MKALPLTAFEDDAVGFEPENTTTAGTLVGFELLAVNPSSTRGVVVYS